MIWKKESRAPESHVTIKLCPEISVISRTPQISDFQSICSDHELLAMDVVYFNCHLRILQLASSSNQLVLMNSFSRSETLR